MNRASRIALIFLVLAAAALADDQPSPKPPLDQLLDTPISTASKYERQLSSVAAAVSVITAEEIERYGWTSLDEVLQSVRGFYLTYDRDHTAVGFRGIGQPNDYNSRFLLLIDGTPANDSLFGAAPLGSDLALDLGTVEKIEIVRGPGSALYGSHAMLAVINIVTKNGDAIDGVSVAALGGSRGRRGAALRSGKQFANGIMASATADWQEISGNDLFFPQFDTPADDDGVARGLDYENLHSFTAAVQKGNFRLSASTRWRLKGVPTAAYGSDFNRDSNTTNEHDMITANYQRTFGSNKTLELRGAWGHDLYQGHWAHSPNATDRGSAIHVGGEARFLWDIRPNQRLTIGGEYTDLRSANYDFSSGSFNASFSRPDVLTSFYAQYEGHFSPQLALVAGIRRDDLAEGPDWTSPRAGILFTPSRTTTFKLLYGHAFRSPNIFESADLPPLWRSDPNLKPETIRTTELVWEQKISPDLAAVASAFHISTDDLIDQQFDYEAPSFRYENLGSLDSNGVELGLAWHRQDGLWARLSGALQHGADSKQMMTNSPQYLLKGNVSTSPWRRFSFGVEAVAEAQRRTRDGEHTDPFLLLNATISRQLTEHFRLGLTSRNLLNAHYSTPVGSELQPQSIRQDGRTLMLRLTYTR